MKWILFKTRALLMNEIPFAYIHINKGLLLDARMRSIGRSCLVLSILILTATPAELQWSCLEKAVCLVQYSAR